MRSSLLALGATTLLACDVDIHLGRSPEEIAQENPKPQKPGAQELDCSMPEVQGFVRAQLKGMEYRFDEIDCSQNSDLSLAMTGTDVALRDCYQRIQWPPNDHALTLTEAAGTRRQRQVYYLGLGVDGCTYAIDLDTQEYTPTYYAGGEDGSLTEVGKENPTTIKDGVPNTQKVETVEEFFRNTDGAIEMLSTGVLHNR